MELYLQAAALVLIAVILGLVLNAQQKVFGVLLSLGTCGIVCLGVVRYLEPVLETLDKLRDLAGISDQMLSILLKTAGIGLVSELVGLICVDGGYGSLGKGLHILSNAVILWLSLPLFDQLLNLLQEVLGQG